MSDLSKVLGDLFGGTDPDGAPVKEELSAEDRGDAQPRFAIEPPEADLTSVLHDALATAPNRELSAAEAADAWAEKLDEPDGRTLHTKGALRAWTRNDDDFLPERGRKWNHRRKSH